MRYPGGKNGGGLYQQIICQMPPHRVYVEPFAGSAAVLRMKRPAYSNLAIDLDPGAVGNLVGAVPAGTELRVGDGIEFLEEWYASQEAVVYCDPPYLATLTPQRYRFKMGPAEHERLLGALRRLRCAVLISGYRSPLYERLLGDWRRVEFPAWTRGGPAIEVLWCNFAEPKELHDYRFLGTDHRKRLDIRRQQERWRSRLMRMDRLQRLALMEVLCSMEVPAAGGCIRRVRPGMAAINGVPAAIGRPLPLARHKCLG